MTVEEIRGSSGVSNEIDRFPIGMRVLTVDDDPTCLKLLDGLLRKCQYQGYLSSNHFNFDYLILGLFFCFCFFGCFQNQVISFKDYL